MMMMPPILPDDAVERRKLEVNNERTYSPNPSTYEWFVKSCLLEVAHPVKEKSRGKTDFNPDC